MARSVGVLVPGYFRAPGQMEQLLRSVAAVLNPVFVAADCDMRLMFVAPAASQSEISVFCANTAFEYPRGGAIVRGVSAGSPTDRQPIMDTEGEAIKFATEAFADVIDICDTVLLLSQNSVISYNAASNDGLLELLKKQRTFACAAFSFGELNNAQPWHTPMITPACPKMPGNNEVLLVKSQHLLTAAALPNFECLGPDTGTIIAATAWLADPLGCRIQHGINGIHKKCRSNQSVYPSQIYPDLFVGRNHGLFYHNGVRGEVIANHLTHGKNTSLDLGLYA